MFVEQNNVIYKKNIKFKNEQNDILYKIYEILNLNEQNKIFYSHNLDKDILKINKIMDLKEQIGNYFKVSTWVTFKKNMKIEYSCSSCTLKNEDNKYINTTIYILNKLI